MPQPTEAQRRVIPPDLEERLYPSTEGEPMRTLEARARSLAEQKIRELQKELKSLKRS